MIKPTSSERSYCNGKTRSSSTRSSNCERRIPREIHPEGVTASSLARELANPRTAVGNRRCPRSTCSIPTRSTTIVTIHSSRKSTLQKTTKSASTRVCPSGTRTASTVLSSTKDSLPCKFMISILHPVCTHSTVDKRPTSRTRGTGTIFQISRSRCATQWQAIYPLVVTCTHTELRATRSI